MGILRIKKAEKSGTNSQLIREDLFRSDKFYDTVRTSARRVRSRLRNYFLGLGALIVIVGLTLWIDRPREKESALPYVFYDVKAIDDQGHPVAGAQVLVQSKRSGITDSFGEWRRFMRTNLGARVNIKVVKKYQDRTISAFRMANIPAVVPQQGEIEIAMTLQLTADVQENPVVTTEASLSATSNLQKPKIVEVDGTPAEGSALKAANAFDSIQFSMIQSAGVGGTALDRQAATYLGDKVMRALQDRAKGVGLKVDERAQWRVTLRHINGSANPETKGIVIVSANAPGSDSKIEFLKNYQADPVTTARSILWGLKMHAARGYTVFKKADGWYVNSLSGANSLWSLTDGMVLMGPMGKSFTISAPGILNPSEPVRLLVGESEPCERKGVSRLSCVLYSSHVGVTAPAANWSKLKTQIYGLEDGASVFVSGYQAVHEGGKIWSYWAVPDSDANLTVISDGRVVFRRKVSSPINQTPVITIPVAKMSQK